MSMLNDKEIELIQRFLEYDLDESELKIFQERLENDQTFAREVVAYKKASNTIGQIFKPESEVIKTPNLLTDTTALTNNKKKESGRIIRLFRRIAIPAAAAILLIVGLSYFFSSNNVYSIQSEVLAYSELMSEDFLRGEKNENETKSLDQQNLERSIKLIKEGQFDQGIEILKAQIVSTKDLEIQELAHWWLVNAYLQQNKPQKAKQTLKAIKQNSQFNSSKKAIRLLEKL